jgi:putative FmdB family regulatory protein
MPIYGYRCSQCGHELEVLQSMSDAPLRVCPECGGSLSKLLYPVGVQFKGSGFYTTDYKNGGRSSKSAGSSDAGSESSKEGSSSSSSSSSSETPAKLDQPKKTTESPAGKE